MHDINQLEINPVSKSALLTAALHHISIMDHVYPWQILSLDGPDKISTSFTVSIDQPGLMLDEINQSPFAIIKIKMGFDGDELLISELTNVQGKDIQD